MLDWLVTTFAVSGCLIVRHPFSTVASTLRVGWKAHLQAFLDDEELMRDHLEPYERVIRSAQSPAETRSVVWAVSTKLALESSARHGIPVVKYEALCRDPEGESRRLFQSLGLPWHDEVSRFVRETSSENKGGEFAIYRNSYDMATWESALSPQQAREVTGVCRSFGFDPHDW